MTMLQDALSAAAAKFRGFSGYVSAYVYELDAVGSASAPHAVPLPQKMETVGALVNAQLYGS